MSSSTEPFFRDLASSQVRLAPEGSGIFISAGSAHKARAVTPVVRLLLVEDVEPV